MAPTSRNKIFILTPLLLQLKKFPTTRFTFPILSYLGTVNYLKDPPNFVHAGIKKVSPAQFLSFIWHLIYIMQFQGRLFKIPTPMDWWIVVSKPGLVEDLRKAPEHILSANRSLGEVSLSIIKKH